MAPTLALGGVMGLGTWLGFAFGVLAPFLVADLGWSELQAGSLTSVMYASGAVLAPVAGWAVDHLGARRTALLVPVVVAGAHLVVASGGGFGVVALGAGIGGLALAATNPATNRLVVEALPPQRRGVVMGWKQAGVSVAGFTVGALLPTVAAEAGWQAAAVVGAAVAVVVAVPLAYALPRPAATSSPALTDTARGHGAGGVATYAAIMGAVNGALIAYLVLYAVQVLDLSARVGGAAVATLGLVAIGARVGWSALGGRVGRHVELLRAVSVLAAAGMLLLALAPRGTGVGLLAAAVALGGTAMSWHALAMLAAVTEVPVAHVGRVSGTVTRAFYGGYVVGPVAFGLLIDQGVAYRTGWWIACGLALAASLAPRRRSDRDHRPAGAGVDRRHPG